MTELVKTKSPEEIHTWLHQILEDYHLTVDMQNKQHNCQEFKCIFCEQIIGQHIEWKTFDNELFGLEFHEGGW